MFVLASASRARHALLCNAGILHKIIVSDVDEKKIKNTDIKKLVQTLSCKKAESVFFKLLYELKKEQSGPNHLAVLGCDSLLEFKGQVYGKPINAEEAISRWKLMSSNTGIIHTGHCLIYKKPFCEKNKVNKPFDFLEGVVSTKVRFSRVSNIEIEEYVNTGEPIKCAGGFSLEGLGGSYIDGLEGCYSNVIGLSLPWLRKALVQSKI